MSARRTGCYSLAGLIGTVVAAVTNYAAGDPNSPRAACIDQPAGPAQEPDGHCFREDGCDGHGDISGDVSYCCCCGYPAEAHTGCDCA